MINEQNYLNFKNKYIEDLNYKELCFINDYSFINKINYYARIIQLNKKEIIYLKKLFKIDNFDDIINTFYNNINVENFNSIFDLIRNIFKNISYNINEILNSNILLEELAQLFNIFFDALNTLHNNVANEINNKFSKVIIETSNRCIWSYPAIRINYNEYNTILNNPNANHINEIFGLAEWGNYEEAYNRIIKSYQLTDSSKAFYKFHLLTKLNRINDNILEQLIKEFLYYHEILNIEKQSSFVHTTRISQFFFDIFEYTNKNEFKEKAVFYLNKSLLQNSQAVVKCEPLILSINTINVRGNVNKYFYNIDDLFKFIKDYPINLNSKFTLVSDVYHYERDIFPYFYMISKIFHKK